MNEPRASALLCGVGSPVGDDAVGWVVAREFVARDVQTIQLASPAGLLDRLPLADDGAVRPRLAICDGCCGLGRPGAWRRFDDLDELPSFVRGAGSHDLSLAAALSLARRLRLLPDETTLWLIEIDPRTIRPENAWREDRGLAALSTSVAAAATEVLSQWRLEFGACGADATKLGAISEC